MKNFPKIVLNKDRLNFIEFIRAYNYAEDIQACLDTGMDGHILKPIDVKHVRVALSRARKQRQ